MGSPEFNQSKSKRGGRRPGAGRKPGSVTKRSREIAEAFHNDNGLTPLAYMVGVLRQTEVFDQERFAAAKEAAPYIHAKLAAVDANVSGELAVGMITYPGLDDDDAA